MKAYSPKLLNSRGAALAGLGFAVLLVAGLTLGGFASLWVFLASVACAVAAIWTTALFLGSSDYVSLDLARGVVRPGGGGREAPLARLRPLVLRTVGGTGPDALPRKGRRTTMPYVVVARGWHDFVLYQSFSRKKAERRLESLARLLSDAELSAAERAKVEAEARERARTAAGSTPPLRERLAAVAVLLLFVAVGVGVLAFSPLLEYDCSRDGNGAVGCVIHRRLAGVVPLGDVTVPGIVAVSTQESRLTRRIGDRTPPSEFDHLVLVGAAGARWRSPSSQNQYGVSNRDLGREIERLLAAPGPDRFEYVQGEWFPMVIGGVFAGVPLLLLLAGFVLSRVVAREAPTEGARG